ncbi:MAG TPA: hypothetical protein VJL87_01365 [Bdellovibrionota bacterium]|nr:hypothetical protein [Bdellovibrionota bacterium]
MKPKTITLKNVHSEWQAHVLVHLQFCTECQIATSVNKLCKLVREYIDQDYRTLEGTKKHSEIGYYSNEDGEVIQRSKIFVDPFDPTQGEPESEIQEETLPAFDAHFDKIPPNATPIQELICKLLWVGYSKKEIAKKLNVQANLVTKQLKLLKNNCEKSPTLRSLYSERGKSHE